MNRISRALYAIGTLSSILLIGIWNNTPFWLRGDDDWRWPYFSPEIDSYFVISCIFILLYLILALYLFRRGSLRQTAWFTFFACLLLPFGAQFLNNIDPLGKLLFRTVSPFHGGYLTVAMDAHTMTDFLRNFPVNAPGWHPHPQRHPPGVILVFMALEHVFSLSSGATNLVASSLHPWRCDHWPMIYRNNAQYAAAIGSFFTLFLGAFTIFPLLKLARHFYSDREIKPLLLMFPIIPAFTVHIGSWDVAFMWFSVTGFWLIVSALQRDSLWLWAIAGLVFSIGTFMTHALFIAVAGAGIYVLISLFDERETVLGRWQRIVVSGLIFSIALGSLWGAYWGIFDVSYLDVYQANTAPHFEMQSNYWLRLLVNPYDFALFSGFALIGVSVLALSKTIATWLRDGVLIHADRFVIAVWVTLVLLTVSGLSRAEVGRVWIFLIPLFVLTIGRLRLFTLNQWGLLFVVTSAQLIVMQATLAESNNDIPRKFSQPSDARVSHQSVGEQIILSGWKIDALSYEPGSTLQLALFWQSTGGVIDDYTRFVHLYNETSGVVAQSDSFPADGRYQTGCWREGEVVEDKVTLDIGDTVDPGTYQLLVGMYPPASPNSRLQTDELNTVSGTIELSNAISVGQP